MAYNYLGLVNDINSRVNETELTSSNFGTASGFYKTAKDSINSSIRELNQEAFQWPFNFTSLTLTLTAGTMRYNYPSTVKTIDFNTFRVKRDNTFGNDTVVLTVMDYEEYLGRYVDDEYNSSDTSIRTVPRHIIRAPGNQFIVYPSPKEAYELVYEYYSLPTDLILNTDVPAVPDAYRHIIVDGAMFYVNNFRNDPEAAGIIMSKFRKGISNMRSIYINRYEYVRDTRVGRSNISVVKGRVS